MGILGAILRQYKEKTLGILMCIVKGFSAKVREKQHISSVSMGKSLTHTFLHLGRTFLACSDTPHVLRHTLHYPD